MSDRWGSLVSGNRTMSHSRRRDRSDITYISNSKSAPQVRKMIQPSKKCRAPSAITIPQRSTRIPTEPILNPFMAMAMEMENKDGGNRFQRGASKI